MKFRRLILWCCLCWLTSISAQEQYYFPDASTLDPSIPAPRAFLGYPVGEWHTRYDRLVAYLEILAAAAPDRTRIYHMGYTYEQRPQVAIVLSSSQNMAHLDQIRQAHLALADPSQPMPPLDALPAVVWLGYGVHGNEASSAEAAMLTAYYLLAAPQAAAWLNQAVVIIDPCYNPDGRDRHTWWVNMHKGSPPVADPLDREHNEAWPRGRTNHYWFDLNRDWLPATQVESRNRLAFYHQWLPNVATDYHEMGTHATYFFEPTKPIGSENPLVPRVNYEELNNLFANYFQAALDTLGALYYTRESFDNSYPGYGSTYPDLQGGLGLLFEQARSGGHVQATSTEPLTFRFTIRNQLRTSLATVRAAVDNRILLLRYKRWFFEEARKQGHAANFAGWIFTAPHDPTRLRAFLELLHLHHIEAWQLQKDLKKEGHTFKAGASWFVPAKQPQYLLAANIFEPRTNKAIPDSVFYDASAWAIALAWNLQIARLKRKPQTGAALDTAAFAKPRPLVPAATYAYLVDWRDQGSAALLWFLLDKGVHVKTAFKRFTAQTHVGPKALTHGSLLIAVHDQAYTPDSLHELVSQAAQLAGVPVYATYTGRSLSGIDLGSRNFRTVERPHPLMVVGEGVSAYEAGEVWHLLDAHVHMPITKVDVKDWPRVNLWDYNTLVLVSGRYDFSKKEKKAIAQWLAAGHTLIAIRGGAAWAMQHDLVSDTLSTPPKDTGQAHRYDFEQAPQILGAQRIGGVVFEADVDVTHPIGFGFAQRKLYVWRNHNYILPPSKNPFSTVVQLAAGKPQVDGFVHPKQLAQIQGSASVVVSSVGQGRVILLLDNPNFRGFWHGTNRLLLNSLFFGSLIHVPSP